MESGGNAVFQNPDGQVRTGQQLPTPVHMEGPTGSSSLADSPGEVPGLQEERRPALCAHGQLIEENRQGLRSEGLNLKII